MADVTLTAHVYPSANDLTGSLAAGWGKTQYETNMSTKLLAGSLGNNFVISGGLLPGSSVNLNISVPACVAILDGRYVSVSAQSITVGASVTTYLFLKLLKDANGNVSSVAYETNTTGTPPANSTQIGTLVSSGSAITSTTDTRLLGPHGIIAISSGVTWNVPAGIFRIFVEVIGASAGGGGGAGTGTGPGSGGAGGNGGVTSFDTLSTSAATGGYGGLVGAGSGTAGAAHGAGSGGTVNITGRGHSGGNGGKAAVNSAGSGGTGGDGGYTSDFRTVTPGTAITIAIGAAGTAGTAGAGSTPGGAGAAGQAGIILVHY